MANNYPSIWVVLCAYFVVSLCLFFPQSATAMQAGEEEEGGGSVPVAVPAKHGTVVKKDQRWSVVTAEFGEISAVKVSDGKDGFYHVQFITMEPNSLFLPAHLHSDMVFYVDSGNGTLSWVDLEEDNHKVREISLQTGDVYRLRTGSFFYIQSGLTSERRKLRIHAIFSDAKEELRDGSSFGPYSSVRDLVLGFDNLVLQAALNVDIKVIEELKGGEGQPMIVHRVSKVKELCDVHYRIIRTFLGRMNSGLIDVNKKKDKKDKDKNKEKPYNILTADHDVENCNGWSLVVTSKQLEALKDSDFGIFMVNLTKGAMMGPHWNPMTAEIGVVIQGRGMVHVVCPSATNVTECKNTRFRVEEGDVFVVPRYHPMAQISFNNGSFVFMGFTTTQKKNHPQYLVGSASVFQVLDKMVLASSFGVSNTTMDEVLSAQREAIILECTSCAEEEERIMEEEIAREQEEMKKREEEEERKKEEEEAKKEEEEKKKKQEEEEERKEQEEARQKEEEEAKKREEEKRRKEEEEEAAARKQEEEEAKRRQEEEAARQQREQEEAARKQAEEEEARRRKQEEEAARQQEEAQRRQQEEEAARQQEEAQRRQQEEEAARQQEEARRRQQEEAQRRQQEEEAARQQEEAQRRQQEEQTARQQEEARRRQQEEEAAHGGGGGGGEGEAASRQEEEMARRAREAEAAARGQGGQGHVSYEE